MEEALIRCQNKIQAYRNHDMLKLLTLPVRRSDGEGNTQVRSAGWGGTHQTKETRPSHHHSQRSWLMLVLIDNVGVGILETDWLNRRSLQLLDAVAAGVETAVVALADPKPAQRHVTVPVRE